MRNSFSGRIILLVFVGIGLVSLSVSVVVLIMSRSAFTETFGRSQERVFEQIQEELDDLHADLMKITGSIESSWAFRIYLDENEGVDNIQNFQNIYQMEMDLQEANSSDLERLNTLVVGKKGKNYLSRTETVIQTDDEIWESEAVRKAVDNPEAIQYTYSHGAYTATSQDADVIILSKALYFRESMEIYGVILVTLSMDDLLPYYDYFISDYTDWYLVDMDDTVMCSNRKALIGSHLSEKWFDAQLHEGQERWEKDNMTILYKELSYQRCRMVGVVDNRLALERLYNMPLLVVICFAIGVVTLSGCMYSVRDTVKPLSNLVHKMSESRKENFSELVPVEGTEEIQQLAKTYNDMLQDIQNYIGELLNTQREKRQSEIRALQMQINPHYIYNTLASIKWLVYQKNEEKTVRTIDAFISLLRSTISNMDEFITVDQELANLDNYILINHTRYGDRIQVEYYVMPECRRCLLPKMILQPFLENSFFHAFPSGQNGTIQLFVNRKTERLLIRISDNGIGMDAEELTHAVYGEKEHFSGIGIHNIQERLRLIYGEECEVSIESAKGRGTDVKIFIPLELADS